MTPTNVSHSSEKFAQGFAGHCPQWMYLQDHAAFLAVSVLCNDFTDNYKRNKKTPVLLLGRQHSGVRNNSCAESINTGMKKATEWDERSATQKSEPVPPPCEGEFKYAARIATLADTERLFDELTQEKQQAKIIFMLKLGENVVVVREVRDVAVQNTDEISAQFLVLPQERALIVPCSAPHAPVLFCP